MIWQSTNGVFGGLVKVLVQIHNGSANAWWNSVVTLLQQS
jgi:hypothetical protein